MSEVHIEQCVSIVHECARGRMHEGLRLEEVHAKLLSSDLDGRTLITTKEPVTQEGRKKDRPTHAHTILSTKTFISVVHIRPRYETGC